MATIAQILEQIRHAVFGKDVRENIALGIEKCYAETTNGIQNKGILDNNTNFNDIQDDGIYGINSNRTYYNKPSVESGFLLCIKYVNGIISQMCFELDYNKVYVRRLISGTWTDWSYFNDTEWKKRSPYFDGVLPTNTNLNNLTPNSMYGINSLNTYQNLPPNITSGIIMSFRYNFDVLNNFMQQIFFSFGDGIFIRNKLSGTWSSWTRIDFVERNKCEFVEDILPTGSDLNNYKTNGKFGLGSNNTYLNSPLPSSGWLECRIFVSSGTGIYWQRAVDFEGSVAYVRYKIYTNDWSNWIPEDKKDHNAAYYAFGDSTTWGAIAGQTGTKSKYNYPAMTGKLLGLTVKNKAVGGQGLIKDWSTIHTNFINGLDMSDAKLITVGWAYNDYPYYSTINFGSASDTSDTTFIGKYYTIMKEFQQKCPMAQIILVTGYGYPDGQVGPPAVKPTLTNQFTYQHTFLDGNKTTKEVYDTLEAMANLHGWPCVNQAKGTVFNQFNVDDMIGDQVHPTNDGYYRYGQLLSARISNYYSNLSR